MNIKRIVIHCSDTPNDMEVSAEDIHRWHKERGWDGIGYHKVIGRMGQIEQGRPYYWHGAHTVGYNVGSLGICLIGKDKFTDDQWYALEMLVKEWKNRWPKAEVVGHRDLDKHGKTCPNFSVKKWWEKVK